jgi:hypothetical protein
MAKLYVAFLGVVFLAITWSAGRQASEEARLRRLDQQDAQRWQAALEAEHARGALLALQDGDVEMAEWHAQWFGRPVVQGVEAAKCDGEGRPSSSRASY